MSPIDRVEINSHTNGHARDYKVQVSNNHSTWTTVYTKVNGVGGIGGVECIPLSGVSGRYLRLEMSRRNALDHQIEEIEVWGR